MLIALDANIWISERLLRSGTGAAFLHATRRMDARVLLADVTRDEVVAGVERAGLDAVSRVSGGFVTIQSLTGSRPEYKLPSAEDFRKAAEDRIEQVSSLLLRVGVTLEQHNRALARLHEHRPPAETREQYRDCLLWETLLDQGDSERTLVTMDKDFMDKGSGQKRLAAVLQDESGDSISFFTSLADYLRTMEPQIPPMDEPAVVGVIADAVLPIAREYAEERGCRLGQLKDTKLELYATEEPGATAAVFALTMSAFDLPLPEGGTMEEVNLVLSGNCVLREDNKVADLSMDRIDAETPDGMRLPGSIVYMSGSVVIGVSQLPYRVRVPIPSSHA
jgi:hypothetical protein